MDKLLSLIVSKGGVRWGGGGLLAAAGAVLLSGVVTPDAGQGEQIVGASLLVGGIVAALLGHKFGGAIKSKLGEGEQKDEEVKS